MKTYKKLILSGLAVLAFVVFVGKAQALTLSQNNISVNVGQYSTVYLYNVSGATYLSSNSNPNIATVTINGSNLSIYGVMSGSTSATVCDNISGCTVLYITVSGNYNNYGYNNGNNNGLNLSNITLSVGSSITISSSNNYNYSYYNNTNGLYVSSNSNPSVASAVSSSSIPGCYGTNTYSITTGQSCNTTSYPYNYNNNYNTSYIPGCYAGALYSITTGQPCNTTSYNYNNNYNTSYIPGCYGTNVYSITTGQLCSQINGYGGGNGSVVITAISAGSDAITLCQNGGTCNTLNITVAGYANPVNSYYSMSNNSSPTYNSSGIPTVYSTSSAD
jgi:hypothetical protein